MEKKEIQGKVLYKFLTPTSLEVNLSCGKGFKLTASTPEKFLPIACLARKLNKNRLLTLELDGGQLVAISNSVYQLDLRNGFPEIGATVLESTYKKVEAVFQKKEMVVIPGNSALILFVSGAEKEVYSISEGFEQNDYLSAFMDKFSAGDKLSMQQAPDGRLIGITNRTQVCETAWS